MSKRGLTRSVRKYIREEKARIRRVVADPLERERQIRELLERFSPASHERA